MDAVGRGAICPGAHRKMRAYDLRLCRPPAPTPLPPRPGRQSQQGRDSRVPLTPAQKREVDDAFGLFDYAKTGTLDLHEVKVGV